MPHRRTSRSAEVRGAREGERGVTTNALSFPTVMEAATALTTRHLLLCANGFQQPPGARTSAIIETIMRSARSIRSEPSAPAEVDPSERSAGSGVHQSTLSHCS